MRKLFLTVCLLIGLTILLSPAVAAKEETPVSNAAVTTAAGEPQAIGVSTDSAMPSLEADYALPYPGILPDNLFYSLKMLRDRFIGFLISDPLKKAEFNLLQADKRLASGMYLMQRPNKAQLAEETISKAENYFEEAVGKAREAKKQGMDTRDIERQLISASKKHLQVIRDLEKKLKGQEKEKFLQLEKRIQKIEIDANRLGKT